MQRRNFLTSVTGTLAAITGVQVGSERASARREGHSERLLSGRERIAVDPIADLEFESTSSLLDANGGQLTDPSLVTVWAQPSATNEDADGAGDAVIYSDGTPIPLAAVDGRVAGFGAQLATVGTDFRSGNEEFLLNVWDDLIGSGTVVYDESHDSFNTLYDFRNLANYAETQGNYTVNATSNLVNALSNADAVMISSPGTSFTSTELSELSSFVANGGAVLLHDTADYQNYDETANLNDVANALGVGFRFNDDQVIDYDSNGGSFYTPATDEFNWSFPYFSDREGLEIARNTSHTVDVIDIPDGDTVDVRFPSGREVPIRVLGVDTPEKSSNDRFELLYEWEGIESESYLDTWGANASDFGQTELSGETIEVSFDDEEPGIFDPFDRLLAYITYDANGDGTRDADYNARLVDNGYARVYASGFSRLGEFLDREATARSNGTGVWGQSDPSNTSEIRDRDADDLFVPSPESIRTATGPLDRSRVPVTASTSASQSGGFVSYSSDVPLIGLDESANLAAVGGPLIDESYESNEGYAVDTSGYENFVVLTNLVDYLAGTTGDVLIDSGHGQFSADYGLSAEDTAYYQRYLEGVGISFDGVNTLSSSNLSGARALLVTPGPEPYTASEIDAVQSFVANGGAVVLLGNTNAADAARDNLDRLAYALGSDLRFNADSVTDGTNNVNGDSSVPVTSAFDTSFPLFSAYSDSGGGGTTEGSITVKNVNADAAGNDNNNLNDEYVVFENPESADIDLTGYAVEDEAGKHYDFPDGFTLGAGDTVTLHTGSGTDTSSDLYWGYGSPVWNNSGDTVFVFDDSGTQVVSYTY